MAAVAYEPTQDTIFVMGGFYGGSLDHCEQYNINEDKWTSIARLNQKKTNMSA